MVGNISRRFITEKRCRKEEKEKRGKEREMQIKKLKKISGRLFVPLK